MFRKLFERKAAVDWIVVGLGNPERKFDGTRHNIGFDAIDAIAAKKGFQLLRKKYQGLTAVEKVGSQRVLFLKPMTYMNLSGNSVGEAARYLQVPAQRVIVLCDDVNLDCGVLRIREKGSAGGHNGLKSIIAQLGSSDFYRIRIGVREKQLEDGELVDYVLGTPSKAAREKIEARFEDILSTVELITDHQFTLAQSRYNGTGSNHDLS